MLPVSFDSSGWRLSLKPVSIRDARLLLRLADGQTLDLLAEADEPAITQLGEGAKITRTFALRGHLLGRATWTCMSDSVSLHVHLKAERELTLDCLTYLEVPLNTILLDGTPPTGRLLVQPADLGLGSAPGAYPLNEGPTEGTMALVVANDKAALALGQVGEPRYFINFSTADGHLRAWMQLGNLTLQPGQELISERLWFTTDPSALAAIERYGDQFAPLNRYAASDVCGWNSWDYYLHSINQEMIEENIDTIDARPWLSEASKAIVIDDGWQNSRGDWRPGSHFDLPAYVARCQAKGRLAGIWLAPFCVDTRSPLVRQRPDLLCIGEDGLPQIGLMWYILDVSQAEAEQMIRKWFRDLYAIGFRYFKVDFVFVLFLAQKMANEDEPRLALVRRLLRAIREEIGDSYFLGCSSPPEAVIGICDGNRIGADIRADWGAIVHAASTVGAKYWMHNRLYVSDADFVVVRSPATSDDPWREHPMTLSRRALQAGLGGPPMPPMPTNVTAPTKPGAPEPATLPGAGPFGHRPQPLTRLGETRCWATVSLLAGGPLTLSDRLSQLNDKGWAQIETMFSLFNGEAARPLDLLTAKPPAIWVRADDAPLLALFNWADEDRQVSVSLADLPVALHASLRDAWSGAVVEPQQGSITCQVPARDVYLLQPLA